MANVWGVPAGGVPPPKMDWADEMDKVEESPADEAFPTLGAAAKAPPPKKKEKAKPVKLGLQDFIKGSGPSEVELRMQLPTGSRGKVDGEESATGLGGAFKDYGGERRGALDQAAITGRWAAAAGGSLGAI